MEGHVCNYCVPKSKASPANPRRTDFCVICNHRMEGVRLPVKKGIGGAIVLVDTTAPAPGQEGGE